MKILFAADEHSYSEDALFQVARLAENTWADITLLGISNHSENMTEIVKTYHQKLSGYFDPRTSVYLSSSYREDNKDIIQKQIVTRTGKGSPVKQILGKADKEGADLIVIGCSTQNNYVWKNEGEVPLKVARDANCSVLVIKEEKKINRVLTCLDHDNISQESLEMVSQMVTLFKANLDIVVLTDGDDVEEKIENKLSWLINYYSSRNIFPCIELVKLDQLEAFITRKAQWGLMAMWMGKKSILERVFPSNKVSRLLKANASSVLLLR